MKEILSIKDIIIYLLIINFFSFISMGIDKYKAKKGKWRTKEKTLMMLVILGGGIGGILGMYSFRHKTKKPKFYIGFPLILSIELISVIYMLLT